MPSFAQHLLDRWHHRYWHPEAATAAFASLSPVTVVTGASEGIGRALAGEFARAGSDLLLVARNANALAKVAAELASTAVAVRTLAADLATETGCASIEAALASAGAYCDVLVNDAGIGLGGPFVGQSRQDLHRLLDLNIGAVTDLTSRFLPGMLVRGEGGILNVASLGGLAPGPNQAAYYASKAYVISLTEALADEVAGQGVRISALVPGPVATMFHARSGTEHSYHLTLIGVMSPEAVARAGFRGFRQWRTLVFPGLLNHINAVALRFLPHRLIIPVIGWMLRQRQAG